MIKVTLHCTEKHQLRLELVKQLGLELPCLVITIGYSPKIIGGQTVADLLSKVAHGSHVHNITLSSHTSHVTSIRIIFNHVVVSIRICTKVANMTFM